MKLRNALITSSVLLVSFRVGRPAELQNQFEVGRGYYQAGEFKKAIAHFERAVRTRPDDARCYFWIGKSYETLAVINGHVFGGHAGSQAHKFLAEAVQLAPENREYRHELFEFLVEFDYSRGTLREAENMLQTVSESDPDYPLMQRRLADARDDRSTPEYRAGSALVVTPVQAMRIARRPVSFTHPPAM